MPKQRPCSRCGNPMSVGRGSLPAGERTCRGCRALEKGPYHPNTGLQEPALRTCDECGVTYLALKPWQRFHNAACRYKWRRKNDPVDRARQQARLAARPSTAARGYGQEHTRLRAEWARKVKRGQVTCWRCGQWIPPDAPWDLGHDDYDRSKYKGPEHAACNRGAPRRRQGQARKAQLSRTW